MKIKSRITSILQANYLDDTITGIKTFNLASLDLTDDLEFELPTHLRLGHLVEKIVAELIKNSSNYNVLYENIQIIEDKKTIGEIDFIIENIKTKQLIHLELAYKFYLYDPNISNEEIKNWIGPNRKDSLIEKLDKLKQKQFPLLHHPTTVSTLQDINTEKVNQALCFLVSLFVPYQYNSKLNPLYEKAIKGYYLNFETFINLNHNSKSYYIPPKSEWGIEPDQNDIWHTFQEIKHQIKSSIDEKQALLCWQKNHNKFEIFFITFW